VTGVDRAHEGDPPVTVTVPLYVFGERPAGFTVTATVPGVIPLRGAANSQEPEGLVETITLKLVGPVLLDTDKFSCVGPPGYAKVSVPAGVTDIEQSTSRSIRAVTGLPVAGVIVSVPRHNPGAGAREQSIITVTVAGVTPEVGSTDTPATPFTDAVKF
jgi:hypothetical protein